MIEILDTTLREGEQTPGVFFDNHIKLAIAELLEQVGVTYIEAGHPLVSAEIYDAVKKLANRKNRQAIIAAHSRCMQKDVDLALECGVEFIGLFYCVSDERLNGVFNNTLTSAVDQINEVIRYAKQKNPNIIIRFTPEDAVRSDFNNVAKASVAAAQAGADIISIADTTGYMIPGTERNYFDYLKRLKNVFLENNVNPKIAVHCHNDRGLALANALDAYQAGANIIDATVLNLGERTGIVDLAQLLTVLTIDFGEKQWNLKILPKLYKLISHHANFAIPKNFPIIGKNAFTHCAGVHTHAATKNPLHYESLNPEIVNRQREICLDHMSGISSVRWALKKINVEADDELAQKILKQVKEIGQRGRTVDLDELPHIVAWFREHDY
ncbi:MAG: 2-isopropylmalate synthase [Patescibacteria group bacterium]